MMTLQRFLLVFFVVAMTGCTAFQLRDANQALTIHYQALESAQKNAQWRIAEDARVSLDNLAKDSAAQAEKESDARNKIAFYRVATIATWQSESSELSGYAAKGGKLCDGENFNKAPRDCSMLTVVPVLAAVDQTSAGISQVDKQARSGPPDERPNYAPQAEKLFTDLKNNLDIILSRRTLIMSSNVHPEFVLEMDKRIEDLLCQKMEINGVGLLSTTRGNVPQAVCTVYNAKKTAKQAGLKASCTAGEIAQPANC
ncbi:hypothetical protein [Aliikangiella coralliicola]|uniref:Uncharacterized protein n=1 Tax=Aliikangiella coralliicola TaxID=2592383 RepID=A0A545UC79_9GAMM|nr:hypothetical protein [Aliikangiella coralliicola]TQV87072.1 hypothetical protein FLL46_14805 [Aliikangiella coralliicola]